MEEIQNMCFEWGDSSSIDDYCRLFALILSPDDENMRDNIYYAKKLSVMCEFPGKFSMVSMIKFNKLCMNYKIMEEYFARQSNSRKIGICIKYYMSMIRYVQAGEIDNDFEISKGKAYHIFRKRFEEKERLGKLKQIFGGMSEGTLVNLWRVYSSVAPLSAAWITVTSKAKYRKRYSLKSRLLGIDILSKKYANLCEYVPFRQNQSGAKPLLKRSEIVEMKHLANGDDAIVEGDYSKILKKVDKLYKIDAIMDAVEDYKVPKSKKVYQEE